jgi:glycolate oxidase subunit GlcD
VNLKKEELIKELAKIVGRENVLCSQRDLLAYSYDATQRQEMPEVVVLPHDTTEISKIMKLAYRNKTPVIPRGAGTGISGGTVPIKGGIVLELSRMNRIIAMDTANRRSIVEPGVINLDLQDALALKGYMYPPDPASQKSCTLGGNIGENAGGPLCLRYGVTSKYVCGMEVVLPDGEVVELGGEVEDVPGYDLRGLMIGSEGTFGVATRLVLHIVPLPEASKTMLAVFDKLENAGQAVSDIISAGIVPASLELMDKKMCGAIEQSLHAGYPVDAEGVLLIEISGLTDGLDKQVKAISEICQKNKVRELRTAKTGAERDALWKGRKGAFGSVARICPPYMVNDGTVPRNQLVPALLKVQEISAKYHVQIATVAHAGDGNLHPLILYDRNNLEETKAAKKTSEEILDTCLALGGTISGEHGIGLEKLAAMSRMFSTADLAAMRKVKQVFDPLNILNPGKLLPPETAGSEPSEEKTASGNGNTDSKAFYEKLIEIVGEENLQSGDQVDSIYKTDGLAPGLVVFASDTEQVSHIIKAANRYQKTIVIRGRGSKQNQGRCITACDAVLCLKNFNQVLDLDRGNSTVRVGAGIGHADLQKQLAPYHLFFPLDPFSGENATIGGDLATADSGPGRLMYGNARDLVLGLTVVTPEGEILHPGGKTMKNVAGLDLCKMFVGSWGTLGVITEAVLRLFPVPEVKKGCGLVFPGAENAFRLVNRILNSKLTPGSMELIDRSAGRYMESDFIPLLKEDEMLLLIGLEGSSEVVERQLKDIYALAQEQGVTLKLTLEGAKSDLVWKAYRKTGALFINKHPAAFTAKASAPIMKSEEMEKAAKEIGKRHKLEIGIQAHGGNGILYLYVPTAKEDAVSVFQELEQAARGLGGIMTLETAPLQVRENKNTWSSPNAYALMGRLKSALDPHNILNPGKMIGGQ